MKFIADFHIHSHYSIATSNQLNPEYLDYWAKIKGISIVGTGDFTHPGWLAELKEKLAPAEAGLYQLKNEYKIDNPLDINHASEIRFMLTAEISTIYKKQNKIRKVHHLILSPDFETVEKIQAKLNQIGNITSDGRPILGLDSRNLLEIVLEANENILFIPAHIWTPWFSVLGDKSGFETITECYDDLTNYIYAIETGLSSDPPMNWICSFLDKFTIISNSDAHSPEKLGREANIFNTEKSYNAITAALKKVDPGKLLGTIEFFPQEGKYHHDGHRKCNINWDPLETKKNGGICPVCGKKVTIGVMNRVIQLSDREEETARINRLPFYSIIPLKEILSEILSISHHSKKLDQVYINLIKQAGSEFNILLDLPIDEIKKYGNDILAEAIKRMRNNEVYIKEGFDGEYGKIKVFMDNEQKKFDSQVSLFHDLSSIAIPGRTKKNPTKKDLDQIKVKLEATSIIQKETKEHLSSSAAEYSLENLNPLQEKSVNHLKGPAMIVAGPGTGKTRVITFRIANLIKKHHIPPENILAVTFTNKAANEMKIRLKPLFNDPALIEKPTISTFHALGYSIIKGLQVSELKVKDWLYSAYKSLNNNFSIISEEDKYHILNTCLKCEKRKIKKIMRFISLAKQNLQSFHEINDEEFNNSALQYVNFLSDNNLLDLDDLIFLPVQIFLHHPQILSCYQKKYDWIMIDEYQDINYAQYQLIKILSPENKANLYVIGDPDQAIYSFRGSDIQFINRFMEDYPQAIYYKLTQSYRCSNSILKAANQVIKIGNKNDPIIRGFHEGCKIKIVQQNSDKSEAEFVARSIENKIGGLRFFSMDSNISQGDDFSEIQSLADFAVISRTNGQLQTIEKAFQDHNIPYQTVGEIPFFQKEPIHSILDILRLLKNPYNNYLKNKMIDKKRLGEEDIKNCYDQMGDLDNLKQILTHLFDHFFQKEKIENQLELNKLLELAKECDNHPDTFIQYADSGTAIDAYQANLENVSLMTIHAAKGLEFTCVFIIGCEDGLIPYSLYDHQNLNFDEERRLLYVGMTRAKRYLYLTHASKRFFNGKEHHLKRSPFLDTIEHELIESLKDEYSKKYLKDKDQLTLF